MSLHYNVLYKASNMLMRMSQLIRIMSRAHLVDEILTDIRAHYEVF